jgi:hypothetical protein
LPATSILLLESLTPLDLLLQKIEQPIHDLAVPGFNRGIQFLPKFTQLLHALTYTSPDHSRKRQLQNGRVRFVDLYRKVALSKQKGGLI